MNVDSIAPLSDMSRIRYKIFSCKEEHRWTNHILGINVVRSSNMWCINSNFHLPIYVRSINDTIFNFSICTAPSLKYLGNRSKIYFGLRRR